MKLAEPQIGGRDLWLVFREDIRTVSQEYELKVLEGVIRRGAGFMMVEGSFHYIVHSTA